MTHIGLPRVKKKLLSSLRVRNDISRGKRRCPFSSTAAKTQNPAILALDKDSGTDMRWTNISSSEIS
jgi:hypothetical protein